MSKRRVLYVAHNHPAIRPGGAEAYALELYEAMKSSNEFEPIFVAHAQAPVKNVPPRRDTRFAPANGDPRQYYFLNNSANYDLFFGRAQDKQPVVESFRDFLRAFEPDVVHFQHTLNLGYDLIRETRQTLPDAAIVYTLHEFLPICHHHGQMVRTFNHELCTHASPKRCHECYPHIAPELFFLRRQFVKSHFDLADLFLSPSRFLLQRYVEWGIPSDKIRFEENGRRTTESIEDAAETRPRNRLAFFGQLTPFKGVEVLLEAMTMLRDVDMTLTLHGANLEYQPVAFQKRFKDLLAQTGEKVSLADRYTHDDLPTLMAGTDWVVVPSIWWENSPLVIQEAFQFGRPVICSDIGGMAEKVIDGVSGLHFRVGDAGSLAEIISRAVGEPELWQSLRRGIPQVYAMAEHVAALEQVYDEVLERAGVRA